VCSGCTQADCIGGHEQSRQMNDLDRIRPETRQDASPKSLTVLAMRVDLIDTLKALFHAKDVFHGFQYFHRPRFTWRLASTPTHSSSSVPLFALAVAISIVFSTLRPSFLLMRRARSQSSPTACRRNRALFSRQVPRRDPSMILKFCATSV